MNELLALQAYLSNAHLTDPRLALANTVAWLDPLYRHTASAIEDDDSTQTEIEIALRICRTCFPDVFAGASQLLLQGVPDYTLSAFICDGVNAYLTMKLDDLEMMGYGIPLDFLGINWTEPDFFDNYPELVDILADFGITPHKVYDDLGPMLEIAQLLCASLEGQSGQRYQELQAALGWLFGGSGNSLIDMSTEDFWESGMEYDEWTPQNILFANDMAQEALDILNAARAGLTTLQQDTELRAAFRHNIELLASKLGGRRIKPRDHSIKYAQRHLRWPERP